MPFTRLQTIRTNGFFSNLGADKDGNITALSYAGDMFTRYSEDGAVSTVLSAQYDYFANGSVTLLADGRYLLATGNDFPFGNTRGVDFQIVNRDGTAATEIKSLYPPEVSIYDQSPGYTVTATPDGGFSIVFTDTTHSSDQFTVTFPQTSDFPHTSEQRSAGQDVYSQHFDATATATGGWVAADANVETVENGTASRRVGDQAIFDTTTLTGGQVAYVYFDSRHEGSNSVYGGAENFTQLSLVIEGAGSNARGIRVDDNPLHSGGPNGDLQNNNEINGASGGNVIALANGTLAVIWEENSYVRDDSVYGHFRYNGRDAYVRYFDAQGNALTAPTVFLHRGTDLGNINSYVWAEALPDGRIVFAYNDGISGVNGNGEIEAHLGTIGRLGHGVQTQRISPDAQNNEFFSVRDLVVRSDGSVDVVTDKNAHAGTDVYPNGTYIEHFTFGYGYNGSVIAGTNAAETLAGGDRNDQIAAYMGDDTVSAGLGNDTVYGNEGNDKLLGGAGNDKLFGNEGDDVLEGGAGRDDLRGGDGLDSASYAASTSAVSINLATGLRRGGDTSGDVYTSIEGIIGTAFNDVLVGDGVANRLDGGAGDDRLTGGLGDDFYLVDTRGDRIVELASGGVDTVEASLNYTLGATLENLVLTGSATTGIGNDAANTITGNALDNLLRGGLGDDILYGGDGNDALYSDGGGSEGLYGGAGNDRLYTSGSNYVRAEGGAGNDTYYVAGNNAAVFEAAGGGNDTVRVLSGDFGGYLDSEIETIMMVGTTGGYVHATGTDNRIIGNDAGNWLTGEGGNDTIFGNGGADALDGGDGNDTLSSGAGSDTMQGRAGADTFVFVAGDTTAGRAGADRIVDFSSDQGDKISLVAIDAIDGTSHVDRFRFIGGAAFHNVAGELRTEQIDGNTFVMGDTNGDGVADLTIQLDGAVTLHRVDFII